MKRKRRSEVYMFFQDLHLNEAIIKFKEKLKCKTCNHERAPLPLYECKKFCQTVYRCTKCGSFYILNYETGKGLWTSEFPRFLIENDKRIDM